MYMYYCICVQVHVNIFSYKYTYYTIRSHYKHLCKLLLRIVIRRSSLLVVNYIQVLVSFHLDICDSGGENVPQVAIFQNLNMLLFIVV